MDPAEPGSLSPGPRPADFARLLLAAGDGPPRLRARDQQADRLGEVVRRRVLQEIVGLDPEPVAFEDALLQIVMSLGEPAGPTRGVCALLRQEWAACNEAREGWAFLIGEALRASSLAPNERRRREPSPWE